MGDRAAAPAAAHQPGLTMAGRRAPRTPHRRGTALAGAAALVLFPAAATAQDAAGLGLAEALRSAAERGAPVRLAREALASSRGGATAAAGAFDVTLRSFVETGRDQTLGFDGAGAPAVNPSHATTVTYGMSVEKRFRSGLTVGPQIEATRVGNTPHVEARNNTATAALVAQMPLLRGRGSVNTAPERAAFQDMRAAEDALSHARARAVLSAAEAYWAYVGARGRLEAQRQAETRARRLVEQTRVLVAAEERPAADLNQLLANLAGKEAARIAAEQAVVAAREALGLAMGLPGEGVAALAPPATPFPAAAGADPDAARLAARALEGRADLRAARGQVAGARLLADAAHDGTRPRLDVSVGVGYTGAEPGRDFQQMFTPFYRSMSAWNASVEVSWERAAANTQARGQAEQARAAQRQREVEADELARAIRSGVTVAAEALRHGRMELERADTAVALWHTVVEAEERKFALGMSTLFDVIQAEDGLTGALLTRIAAQERYATALARLAFETGALTGEEGVVDLDALARPSA